MPTTESLGLLGTPWLRWVAVGGYNAIFLWSEEIYFPGVVGRGHKQKGGALPKQF